MTATKVLIQGSIPSDSKFNWSTNSISYYFSPDNYLKDKLVFFQMLRDYFTTVCKHLTAEHSELLSVERTNRRIMITKGEVHVERKERAEALQVCRKLSQA